MKIPAAGTRGPQHDSSLRNEGTRRTALLLTGLAVLGVAFLAFVLLETYQWTHEHVDAMADQQTRLAVEFDNALRAYVAKHIRPEMEKRVGPGEFIPEAMSSSFVARSVFDGVRAAYPEYVLRFPSTHPRNPANRATEAEEAIIRYFQRHPEKNAWSGTLMIEGRQYVAHAIPRRFEVECMRCHGRPEDAPSSLIDRYGATAGFGRAVGEVSVDLAAVPVSEFRAQAAAQFRGKMLVASAVCAAFLGGVALLIRWDMIRRRRVEEHRERLLIRRQGINQLQQSLLEPASLEENLKKVTDGVVSLSDADFCRVWLIRPGDRCQEGCMHAEAGDDAHACRCRQRCLHLLASSGRYTHLDGRAHGRVPLACYEIGRLVSGEAHKVILNDAANDPQVHDHRWASDLGLVSFAGYQIRVPGGDALGVLGVFAKHPIDVDEDAMLDGLSASVALVVRQAATQEALRQSKEEAEQYAAAVEASNRTLEELNHLAEAATRAKSEFLANMSHEIRAPMTAILGYADLLTGEEGLDRAPPQRRQALETIKRNGEHLLELINGILDLSKVEAGKMQIEPVRCSPFALVAEVVSLMRVRAEPKRLPLRADLSEPLPETMLTDPLRLRQILINLVGNAIKFTDEGEIRVAARLTGGGGPVCLRFDVSDTGIGMNEEQIARLFQPFSQVDGSSTRKFGGTGLGLCISKRLAAALGGDVEVRSAPGEGSTFSVTIDPGPLDGIRMVRPTQPPPLRPPPKTLPAAADKTALRARVLLAEDGPDNQRLFCVFLAKAGADVTAVANGQRAVEAALAASEAGRPFDVILMDMQMPVLDGYAATGQLRERGYSGPIVALTAHAMAEARRECLDAGCDDYVAKPVDREKLLATVAHWTGRPSPRGAAALSGAEDDPRPPSADVLRSKYADDPLIGLVVAEFVGCLEGRVEAMREALGSGELEELRRLAHQLKGAAGSYGYPPLTEAARELEVDARDGRREAAEASLARVAALCRAAVRGWEADPARSPSQPAAAPQP